MSIETIKKSRIFPLVMNISIDWKLLFKRNRSLNWIWNLCYKLFYLQKILVTYSRISFFINFSNLLGSNMKIISEVFSYFVRVNKEFKIPQLFQNRSESNKNFRSTSIYLIVNIYTSKKTFIFSSLLTTHAWKQYWNQVYI